MWLLDNVRYHANSTMSQAFLDENNKEGLAVASIARDVVV